MEVENSSAETSDFGNMPLASEPDTSTPLPSPSSSGSTHLETATTTVEKAADKHASIRSSPSAKEIGPVGQYNDVHQFIPEQHIPVDPASHDGEIRNIGSHDVHGETIQIANDSSSSPKITREGGVQTDASDIDALDAGSREDPPMMVKVSHGSVPADLQHPDDNPGFGSALSVAVAQQQQDDLTRNNDERIERGRGAAFDPKTVLYDNLVSKGASLHSFDARMESLSGDEKPPEQERPPAIPEGHHLVDVKLLNKGERKELSRPSSASGTPEKIESDRIGRIIQPTPTFDLAGTVASKFAGKRIAETRSKTKYVFSIADAMTMGGSPGTPLPEVPSVPLFKIVEGIIELDSKPSLKIVPNPDFIVKPHHLLANGESKSADKASAQQIDLLAKMAAANGLTASQLNEMVSNPTVLDKFIKESEEANSPFHDSMIKNSTQLLTFGYRAREVMRGFNFQELNNDPNGMRSKLFRQLFETVLKIYSDALGQQLPLDDEMKNLIQIYGSLGKRWLKLTSSPTTLVQDRDAIANSKPGITITDPGTTSKPVITYETIESPLVLKMQEMHNNLRTVEGNLINVEGKISDLQKLGNTLEQEAEINSLTEEQKLLIEEQKEIKKFILDHDTRITEAFDEWSAGMLNKLQKRHDEIRKENLVKTTTADADAKLSGISSSIMQPTRERSVIVPSKKFIAEQHDAQIGNSADKLSINLAVNQANAKREKGDFDYDIAKDEDGGTRLQRVFSLEDKQGTKFVYREDVVVPVGKGMRGSAILRPVLFDGDFIKKSALKRFAGSSRFAPRTPDGSTIIDSWQEFVHDHASIMIDAIRFGERTASQMSMQRTDRNDMDSSPDVGIGIAGAEGQGAELAAATRNPMTERYRELIEELNNTVDWKKQVEIVSQMWHEEHRASETTGNILGDSKRGFSVIDPTSKARTMLAEAVSSGTLITPAKEQQLMRDHVGVELALRGKDVSQTDILTEETSYVDEILTKVDETAKRELLGMILQYPSSTIDANAAVIPMAVPVQDPTTGAYGYSADGPWQSVASKTSSPITLLAILSNPQISTIMRQQFQDTRDRLKAAAALQEVYVRSGRSPREIANVNLDGIRLEFFPPKFKRLLGINNNRMVNRGQELVSSVLSLFNPAALSNLRGARTAGYMNDPAFRAGELDATPYSNAVRRNARLSAQPSVTLNNIIQKANEIYSKKNSPPSIKNSLKKEFDELIRALTVSMGQEEKQLLEQMGIQTLRFWPEGRGVLVGGAGTVASIPEAIITNTDSRGRTSETAMSINDALIIIQNAKKIFDGAILTQSQLDEERKNTPSRYNGLAMEGRFDGDQRTILTDSLLGTDPSSPMANLHRIYNKLTAGDTSDIPLIAKILAGMEIGLSGAVADATSFPGSTVREQLETKQKWENLSAEIEKNLKNITAQKCADEVKTRLIDPIKEMTDVSAQEAQIVTPTSRFSIIQKTTQDVLLEMAEKADNMDKSLASLETFIQANTGVKNEINQRVTAGSSFDQLVNQTVDERHAHAVDLIEKGKEIGAQVITISDPMFPDQLREYDTPAITVSGTIAPTISSIVHVITDSENHHGYGAREALGTINDGSWFPQALGKWIEKKLSGKSEEKTVSREQYILSSMRALFTNKEKLENGYSIYEEETRILETIFAKDAAAKDRILQIINEGVEDQDRVDRVMSVISQYMQKYCRENGLEIVVPVQESTISSGSKDNYPRAIRAFTGEARPVLYVAGDTDLLVRNEEKSAGEDPDNDASKRDVEHAIGVVAPQGGGAPKRHLKAQFEKFLDEAMDGKGINLIFRIPLLALIKNKQSSDNIETMFCRQAMMRKLRADGKSSKSKIIVVTDGPIPEETMQGDLFRAIIDNGGCIITEHAPGSDPISRGNKNTANMNKMVAQLSSSLMIMDSIPSEKYIDENPDTKASLATRDRSRMPYGLDIANMEREATRNGKQVFAWDHGDASNIVKNISNIGHLLGNVELISLGRAIPANGENLDQIMATAQESSLSHEKRLDAQIERTSGSSPEERRLLEVFKSLGINAESPQIVALQSEISRRQIDLSRLRKTSNAYAAYRKIEEIKNILQTFYESITEIPLKKKIHSFGSSLIDQIRQIGSQLELIDWEKELQVAFAYDQKTTAEQFAQKAIKIKADLETSLSNLSSDKEMHQIRTMQKEIEELMDNLKRERLFSYTKFFGDVQQSMEFSDNVLEKYNDYQQEERRGIEKLVAQYQRTGGHILIQSPESDPAQRRLLNEARRQNVPVVIVPGNGVYSELNLENDYDENHSLLRLKKIEKDPDVTPLTLDFMLTPSSAIKMNIFGKQYSFYTVRAAYYARLNPSLADYLSDDNEYSLRQKIIKVENLFVEAQKGSLDVEKLSPELTMFGAKMSLATEQYPARILSVSAPKKRGAGNPFLSTIKVSDDVAKNIDQIEQGSWVEIQTPVGSVRCKVASVDVGNGNIIIEIKREDQKSFPMVADQVIPNITLLNSSPMHEQAVQSFEKATMQQKMDAMHEVNAIKFSNETLRRWLVQLGKNPVDPEAAIANFTIHNGRSFTGKQPDEILWGVPNESMKSNNSGIYAGRGYDGLGLILTIIRNEALRSRNAVDILQSGATMLRSKPLWNSLSGENIIFDKKKGAYVSEDGKEIPMENFVIGAHDPRSFPLYGVHQDEIFHIEKHGTSHEIIPSSDVRAFVVSDTRDSSFSSNTVFKAIAEISDLFDINITSASSLETPQDSAGWTNKDPKFPTEWPRPSIKNNDGLMLPAYPIGQLISASHIGVIFETANESVVAEAMRKATLMGKPMIIVRRSSIPGQEFEFETILPYADASKVSIISPYNAHIHEEIPDVFETAQSKHPSEFRERNDDFVRHLADALFIWSFDARNKGISSSLKKSISEGKKVVVMHHPTLLPESWNSNGQGIVNASLYPSRSGSIALLLGLIRKKMKGLYFDNGTSLSNIDAYETIETKERDVIEKRKLQKDAIYSLALEDQKIFGNEALRALLTKAGKEWLDIQNAEFNGNSNLAFFAMTEDAETRRELLASFINTVTPTRVENTGNILKSQEEEIAFLEQKISDIDTLEKIFSIKSSGTTLESQLRWSIDENNNLVQDAFGTLNNRGVPVGISAIARIVRDALRPNSRKNIFSSSFMSQMSDKMRDEIEKWLEQRKKIPIAYLLRDISRDKEFTTRIVEDLASSDIFSPDNDKEDLKRRLADLQEKTKSRLTVIDYDVLEEMFNELVDSQKGLGRSTKESLNSPIIFGTPEISIVRYRKFPDIFAVVRIIMNRDKNKQRTNIDNENTRGLISIYVKGSDGTPVLVHSQSIRLPDTFNLDIRKFADADGTSDQGFVEAKRQYSIFAQRIAAHYISQIHALAIHNLASGIQNQSSFGSGTMQIPANSRPIDAHHQAPLGILDVHRNDTHHDIDRFPYNRPWKENESIRLFDNHFYYRTSNVNLSNIFNRGEITSRITGTPNLGAHNHGILDKNVRDIAHQLAAIPLVFSGIDRVAEQWKQFSKKLIGNSLDNRSKLRLLWILATGFEPSARETIGNVAWWKAENFDIELSLDIRSQINALSIYLGSDLHIPSGTNTSTSGRPIELKVAKAQDGSPTEPGLIVRQIGSSSEYITRIANFFEKMEKLFLMTSTINNSSKITLILELLSEKILSRIVNSEIIWSRDGRWEPRTHIIISEIAKKSKDMIDEKISDKNDAKILHDKLMEIFSDNAQIKTLKIALDDEKSHERLGETKKEIIDLAKELKKIGMNEIISGTIRLLELSNQRMSSYIIPYTQQLSLFRGEELFFGGKQTNATGKKSRGLEFLLEWMYSGSVPFIGPQSPRSPTKDQYWWNSQTGEMKQFDGSGWKNVPANQQPFMGSAEGAYILPSLFIAIRNMLAPEDGSANAAMESLKKKQNEIASFFVNLSPQNAREMITGNSKLLKNVLVRRDDYPMIQQLPFINIIFRFLRSINVDPGATAQKFTLAHTIASILAPKMIISQQSVPKETDKPLKLGTKLMIVPGYVFTARVFDIESLREAATQGGMEKMLIDPGVTAFFGSLDSSVNMIMLPLIAGTTNGGISIEDILNRENRDEIYDDDTNPTIDTPDKTVSHYLLYGVPMDPTSRKMDVHFNPASVQRAIKQYGLAAACAANVRRANTSGVKVSRIDNRYHTVFDSLKLASDSDQMNSFFERFMKDDQTASIISRSISQSVGAAGDLNENSVPYSSIKNIADRQKKAMFWAKMYCYLLAKKKEEIEDAKNGYVESAELNLLKENSLMRNLFPEIAELFKNFTIANSDEWKKMVESIEKAVSFDLLGENNVVLFSKEAMEETTQFGLADEEAHMMLAKLMKYNDAGKPKDPEDPEILAKQKNILEWYLRIVSAKQKYQNEETNVSGLKIKLQQRLDKERSNNPTSDAVKIIEKVLNGETITGLGEYAAIPELKEYHEKYSQLKSEFNRLIYTQKRFKEDFAVVGEPNYFDPETLMEKTNLTAQDLLNDINKKLADHESRTKIKVEMPRAKISSEKFIENNFPASGLISFKDLIDQGLSTRSLVYKNDENLPTSQPLENNHRVYLFSAFSECLANMDQDIDCGTKVNKLSTMFVLAAKAEPINTTSYPSPDNQFCIQLQTQRVKENARLEGIVMLYKIFMADALKFLKYAYDNNGNIKNASFAISPVSVDPITMRSLLDLSQTQNAENPKFVSNAFIKWLMALEHQDNGTKKITSYSVDPDTLNASDYLDLMRLIVRQIMEIHNKYTSMDKSLAKRKKSYSIPLKHVNNNPWGHLPSLAKILYNKINI